MKRAMLKGDRFTHSYTVSPQTHERFIELFGDRNPLHTDEPFSRDKGFEGRVMHGNILNGFLSHFIGELLPIKNVIIQSQEIKYYKPVYLNDELLFTANVVDVHESVNVVEFKFSFSNSNGVKVAGGKIMIGII